MFIINKLFKEGQEYGKLTNKSWTESKREETALLDYNIAGRGIFTEKGGCALQSR